MQQRVSVHRCTSTLLLSVVTASAMAQVYAVDYVATAAQGTAMNEDGTVIAGFASLPPSCDGCQPTFNVPAIWAGGVRHLLSLPAAAAYLSFAGISPDGWVAGSAMSLDALRGRAMLWRPTGGGYEAADLGTLPGDSHAVVAGIDDQNRVFGTSYVYGVSYAPMVWTEGAGMASLTAAGYPGELPVAVSPGGTIGTESLTYRYGDPGSVVAVAPPPAGYQGLAFTLTGGINDDGVRGAFLLSTSSQSLRYMARYQPQGLWQVIASGSGQSSNFGIGSVDPEGAITGTVLSNGVRAVGPSGPAISLASSVSPAYGATTVTYAGEQASNGAILASALIGNSARVVKLVPVQPCVSQCLRVASLALTGRMISERGQSGQCTDLARNSVAAKLTVTDESGTPIRGATVKGRFLDDYYLDSPMTLSTNRSGQANFKHEGPACVGAVAFVVESVTSAGRTLDRTIGSLAGYVIPRPRRP